MWTHYAAFHYTFACGNLLHFALSPQVFLKEHSRDLYSSYTNYTVHSMPMYLLKVINAVLFTVVSWGMMDVDTSTGEHIFLL